MRESSWFNNLLLLYPDEKETGKKMGWEEKKESEKVLLKDRERERERERESCILVWWGENKEDTTCFFFLQIAKISQN